MIGAAERVDESRGKAGMLRVTGMGECDRRQKRGEAEQAQ